MINKIRQFLNMQTPVERAEDEHAEAERALYDAHSKLEAAVYAQARATAEIEYLESRMFRLKEYFEPGYMVETFKVPVSMESNQL